MVFKISKIHVVIFKENNFIRQIFYCRINIYTIYLLSVNYIVQYTLKNQISDMRKKINRSITIHWGEIYNIDKYMY